MRGGREEIPRGAAHAGRGRTSQTPSANGQPPVVCDVHLRRLLSDWHKVPVPDAEIRHELVAGTDKIALPL